MKNKFLNSEILLPFFDYFKIEEKKEKKIKLIIYILLSIVICTGMQFYYKIFDQEEIKNFVLEYINSEIEIIALLLSFSIAYLTILITSDSKNIRELKEYNTNKIIDKKNISLYQILLIQLTYTIYNEIVLLILLLIHKFIFPITKEFWNIIFFTINMILLINIIYVIFKNVKNIYLSFWRSN